MNILIPPVHEVLTFVMTQSKTKMSVTPSDIGSIHFKTKTCETCKRLNGSNIMFQVMTVAIECNGLKVKLHARLSLQLSLGKEIISTNFPMIYEHLTLAGDISRI